jgi:hypothetical protein
MIPLIVVVVVCQMAMVAYLVTRKPVVQEIPRWEPTPTPITANGNEELLRHTIDSLVRVAEMALVPVPGGAPGQVDSRPPAQAMPLLEPAQDDASDPYEAWLPPDFRREVGAIVDMTDEAPLGIPGVRPPEGF